MKKYELFNDIKKGQKITMVLQNAFGFISTIQTVFLGAAPNNHYQNCPENMIGAKILHRPKRKRNDYYTVIDYNADFMIYTGWQDITTDCIYNIEIRPDGTEIRKSKYTSFDKRNFEEIKRAFPDNIIVDSLNDVCRDDSFTSEEDNNDKK